MKDIGLDVFDKYYLLMILDNTIEALENSKRGPSNNTQVEIKKGIYNNLKNIIEDYDHTPKEHRFVYDVNDIGEVDDGSHTFNELYYHRMMLFLMVCRMFKDKAWKSWKHHDMTMYEDYFIVGIFTPEGQFTYHYHKEYWDLFDVKERMFAPLYDGHTSDDITRLFSLLKKEEE